MIIKHYNKIKLTTTIKYKLDIQALERVMLTLLKHSYNFANCYLSRLTYYFKEYINDIDELLRLIDNLGVSTHIYRLTYKKLKTIYKIEFRLCDFIHPNIN